MVIFGKINKYYLHILFPEHRNLNVQYLVEYGNNCHQMALKNMNGKTSILIMKSITTTKENAPEIN
jgi:hypothetical protein